MGAEGRIAYQTLETLVGKVARETAALTGKPLSYFSTAKKAVRLALQLDAARRRTRQFVVCALKTPQLDSQSCFALHLVALGVRFKDHKYGAQQLLASNLGFIEHLLSEHTVR
eukprot:2855027-Pleurochrysis_carterae.AAC.1